MDQLTGNSKLVLFEVLLQLLLMLPPCVLAAAPAHNHHTVPD